LNASHELRLLQQKNKSDDRLFAHFIAITQVSEKSSKIGS